MGSTGYLMVNIYYQPGKSVSKPIHRIVATAYIPNPDNKREVNHINGNKHDNRSINLEWATSQENSQHACRTGLTPVRDVATLRRGWEKHRDEIIKKQKERTKGEGNPSSKLKAEEVVLIRNMYQQGLTVTQISKMLNLKRMNVTDVIKGTTWGCVKMDYNPPRWLRGKPVLKMKDGEILARYERIKEAAISINKPLSHSAISACCRGVKKSYLGFQWKYDV